MALKHLAEPKDLYNLKEWSTENRNQVKEHLGQFRLDGMFGDGLEIDYIMDGVTIVGLNQMNDQDLRQELLELVESNESRE